MANIKREQKDEYNDEKFSEPEQLRKLFIGGLDYNTTDDGLRAHFSNWGEIVDAVVMKDPKTKRSRGFGFITYSQSSMVDNAQNARPHNINGRTVEPKRAIPRQDLDNPNAGATVKKLFVGGLRDDHDKECLREHFKSYGNIVDINVVSDKETGKKRGFAFIEFDDYDPVDKAILQKNHTIKNKTLDIKKAIPKQDMNRDSGAGGGRGGRGGFGDRGNQGGGWNNNRQSGGNGNWNNNSGNFGGNQPGGGGWNQQPQPWNNQGDNGNWNNNAGGGFNNSGNWGSNTNPSWGGNTNNTPWSGNTAWGANNNTAWNSNPNNVGGGGFVNDYQQNYGGGPQRNTNYGGNRPTPYNQGGYNKGGNQGGNQTGFSGNNYVTGNNGQFANTSGVPNKRY